MRKEQNEESARRSPRRSHRRRSFTRARASIRHRPTTTTFLSYDRSAHQNKRDAQRCAGARLFPSAHPVIVAFTRPFLAPRCFSSALQSTRHRDARARTVSSLGTASTSAPRRPRRFCSRPSTVTRSAARVRAHLLAQFRLSI
jgi:hypothetical protein